MSRKFLLRTCRYAGACIAASCLTLPACTMIPKYTRPASPVASTFPGDAGESGLASDIRWRDFFTDAQLRGSSRCRSSTTATSGSPR